VQGKKKREENKARQSTMRMRRGVMPTDLLEGINKLQR
jgi:hypothetical protein